MKICLISHAVHPYSDTKPEYKHSSVNDVLFNLSYGFKSLRHDVFLILPKGSDSEFPAFIADGEYQPNLGIKTKNKLSCTETGSCLSSMMDYAFKKQSYFDIIVNLGHDWLPNYMVGKFTTPYISIPNLLRKNHPLENLIKLRASQYPKNIVFISYFQRNILGNENNKVIYLPFDEKLFLPANEKKEDCLFWAGRIIPEKGLENALIFSEKVNLPLLVAGEIQDNNYYEKLKKKYSFDYLGILNKVDLYKTFSKAKAFLKLQKSKVSLETFGRVTAEAMLNGCPVIYTSNGSNKEIVELVNGGVEYNFRTDPKEVLAKINDIDIQLMQKKSKEKFSRKQICAEYIKYFNDLLEFSS